MDTANQRFSLNGESPTSIMSINQPLIKIDSQERERPEFKRQAFPPLLVLPSLKSVGILAFVCIVVTLCLTVFKKHMGMETEEERMEFFKYASVPVISVIFTYFHIWLALWMTFYPIEFFGLFQLPGTNVGVPGWQGIIPSKAEKMARLSVELMTTKLIDMKKEFEKIDPQIFTNHVEDKMKAALENALEETFQRYHGGLWSKVPDSVKEELVRHAQLQAPKTNVKVMIEVRERMEEIFDIKEFVVSFMVQRKQLLVDMFIACGYQELCFIRNSGATMGGIFGFTQMIIWMFWEPDQYSLEKRLIVFPLIGFVVGFLTNYLALFMIFNPIEPMYICGMKVQGLFLQRQKEVSAIYGNMVATNILNAENILETMIKGPNSDKFFEIVDRHMRASLDEEAGYFGTILAQATIGSDHYNEMRESFIDALNEGLPEAMKDAEAYTEKALDIEGTMRKAMEGLSFHDFERLLHPVFEEDEWKLILIGGCLGVVIGLLQVFFINSKG
jgi:uncharacterized membrane protein YheB (UPF0754 family)